MQTSGQDTTSTKDRGVINPTLGARVFKFLKRNCNKKMLNMTEGQWSLMFCIFWALNFSNEEIIFSVDVFTGNYSEKENAIEP